jgi:hypothetical protein
MPPVVKYVKPEVLNAVKTGMPMELTFSGKMNRTSVESAIGFSPTATATYTWINVYMVSINLSQLEYATNYVLTIDGSIAQNAETGKFLDGAAKDTAGSIYVLNFTTKEQDLVIPKVVSYDPQGDQQNSLRPIVRIEFNKPLVEKTIAALLPLVS